MERLNFRPVAGKVSTRPLLLLGYSLYRKRSSTYLANSSNTPEKALETPVLPDPWMSLRTYNRSYNPPRRTANHCQYCVLRLFLSFGAWKKSPMQVSESARVITYKLLTLTYDYPDF